MLDVPERILMNFVGEIFPVGWVKPLSFPDLPPRSALRSTTEAEVRLTWLRDFNPGLSKEAPRICPLDLRGVVDPPPDEGW